MDRMFLRGLPRAFARRALPPFLPRLHRDWRRILARAWSVRLWAVSTVLIGLEAVVPLLEGVLPVPRGAFAALAGLAAMGGNIARIIQQSNMEDDT